MSLAMFESRWGVAPVVFKTFTKLRFRMRASETFRLLLGMMGRSWILKLTNVSGFGL